MSSSGPPPADAAYDDGVPRRSRITYSREFMLSVAGRDNLPAGINASVLRSMRRHWRVWEIHYDKAQRRSMLLAGVEDLIRDLSIDESSYRHHQEEETNSGGGSGLRWSPKVATAPPDVPCDGPRDVLPPRRALETFQTGEHGRAPTCTGFFSTADSNFGEDCRFLHGLPDSSSSHQQDVAKKSDLAGKMPNAGTTTPASFGASASAKISIDASLAGAIIGRGGANIKQIARVTGAKVAIRDHASDAALKNVELDGTFDQIKDASTMVMELVANASAAPPAGGGGPHDHGGTTPGSKFRTRLCEHFAGGSCFHGDRCRFAHGEEQLRSSGGRSDVDATVNFWTRDEFPSRKGGW